VEDPADNLSDLTLRQLHARLASSDPIPGGGSASALSGAMGASLVAMVAELTIGRPEAAEHRAVIADLRDRALSAQQSLLELAQQDADAYAAVVSARRMPRDTEEQRATRSQAIRGTMLAAAEAPLGAARAAAEVLELAAEIAPSGNVNAVSDAGVASLLAAAAVRGAILNVRINLPYLADDAALRQEAPAELPRLESVAAELSARTAEVVARRMEPA
jgi:formiminotetrahydrofolate cyclodeaminase